VRDQTHRKEQVLGAYNTLSFDPEDKKLRSHILELAHVAISNLAGNLWTIKEKSDQGWKYMNLYQFLEHTAEIIDIYWKSVSIEETIDNQKR